MLYNNFLIYFQLTEIIIALRMYTIENYDNIHVDKITVSRLSSFCHVFVELVNVLNVFIMTNDEFYCIATTIIIFLACISFFFGHAYISTQSFHLSTHNLLFSMRWRFNIIFFEIETLYRVIKRTCILKCTFKLLRKMP